MSERLTQYFEVGNYTEKQNIIDVSNKLPLFENGVIMGKAIDRLAEFEDFMEEQGFESLELLKATLKMKTQSIKGFEKLNQKNQAFKNRWQKLKEWVVKEQGYASMNQEERFNTLEEVKDKMQELEQE